jgi:RNA polymerase sigma-70 factor (ECF subfamily)
MALTTTDDRYDRAYAEHWHDLFRFCLAHTNDWGEAEELTQEAYVRLWQRRSAFDWSEPVLPWLLVTAGRLATDRFRRLRRRFLSYRSPTTLDESVRDRWLDLERAMAHLSELERTALVVTTIQGFSYADAAILLRTSPGALRAAVARARAKLEQLT